LALSRSGHQPDIRQPPGFRVFQSLGSLVRPILTENHLVALPCIAGLPAGLPACALDRSPSPPESCATNAAGLTNSVSVTIEIDTHRLRT
jgi:hypothetical protein